MKTSDSFILFRLLFPGFHAVPCRRPILQRSARGLRLTARRMIALLLGVVAGFAAHTGQAGPRQSNPAVGPTGVIVQTQFGGQIFGFDIDQASNEGILCEAQTLDDGSVQAAIETFNQTTGAIIKDRPRRLKRRTTLPPSESWATRSGWWSASTRREA